MSPSATPTISTHSTLTTMQLPQGATIISFLCLCLLLNVTFLHAIVPDQIQMTKSRDTVHQTFNVPSQLPDDSTRHTIRFAFPGYFKDRWVSQVGPLSTVPTDCTPTANQSTCIGGAKRFAALLKQSRELYAQTNEAVLFFMPGDYTSGSSFGRVGHGAYAARYLYLMGADAVGVSGYEFHPELGGKFQLFLDSFKQLYINNDTFTRGGIGEFNADWIADQTNTYITKSNTSAPMILSFIKLRPVGWMENTTFNILAPPDEDLPLMYPNYIVDYGLDTQAIADGKCYLNSSSCTNTATTHYGAVKYPAVSTPQPAEEQLGRKRVGLLTWNDNNLVQATSVSTQFAPEYKDRIYMDSNPAHTTLNLQKEVSILQDSGINQIIVITQAELSQPSQDFLMGIIGIDVILIATNIVYPSWWFKTSITGSPVLFLSCSVYMLHYCIAEIKFDSNGNIREFTFNSTVLDSKVDSSNSLFSSVIDSDYLDIFKSAITTQATTKAYPPTFPVSSSSAVRFFETDDGNMAADSGRLAGDVQIGLCNSGAIRTVLPKGPVTVSDIQSFMPFENNWIILNITGAVLWDALENSVSLSGISNSSAPGYTTSGRGKFLQVSGLRFSWNPKPFTVLENRILSVEVLQFTPRPAQFDTVELLGYNYDSKYPLNNTAQETAIQQSLTYHPLDPDSWYTINIPSFEAANGDGYTFLNNSEAVQIGSTDTFQVTLISYLARQRNMVSKVSTEGRIKIDATRFPPKVLTVSPAFADITAQTNILISGRNLYTGSDASNTTITFRSSRSTLVVPCLKVKVAAAENTPANQQAVICEVASASSLPEVDGKPATTLRMRIFVNSGSLGAETFTTFSLFSFSAGSLADACNSNPDTTYLSGKGCVCRPGLYNIDPVCELCQPRCTKCKLGHAKNTPGNVECDPCEVGTYADVMGLQQCLECDSDTYWNTPGGKKCEPCPANSGTNREYSVSRNRCYCKSGYINAEDLRRQIERLQGNDTDYSLFSDPKVNGSLSSASYGPARFDPLSFQCTACLPGGACDPQNGDMRVRPGRYFDAENARFLACLNPEQCCTNTDPTGLEKYGSIASCQLDTPDEYCSAHRTGYLCASCVSGYQSQLRSVLVGGSQANVDDPSTDLKYHGSPSRCVRCEEPNAGLLTLLCIIGLIYLIFVLFNTPGKSDFTKILIDFYQMCALVLLPDILSAGAEDATYFQIFHLRMDIIVGSSKTEGSCIVPVSSLANMVLHAIIGPMLFAALGAIAFTCWMCTLMFPSIRHGFSWWRFRMASWQLLLFGFMGTISGAFNLLHCTSVGNVSLLAQSPDVRCWRGAHTVVGTLSIIAVVLLCLIVPVTIVLFVRRLRLRLKSAFLAEQIKDEGANPNKATLAVNGNNGNADNGMTTISEGQVLSLQVSTASPRRGSQQEHSNLKKRIGSSKNSSANQNENGGHSLAQPLTSEGMPSSSPHGNDGGGSSAWPSSAPRSPAHLSPAQATRRNRSHSLDSSGNTSGGEVRNSSDDESHERSISNSADSQEQPEKLDMEKVARRIYRKSGFVSVARRAGHMWRQKANEKAARRNTIDTSSPIAPNKMDVEQQSPVEPPSPNPAGGDSLMLPPPASPGLSSYPSTGHTSGMNSATPVKGVRIEPYQNASTGLNDMLDLGSLNPSPRGVVAQASQLAMVSRLDNYGNPLARFKHYAASSDTNSTITIDELVRDAELELTPFEKLLLSHGILFLAYKSGWRWFEGAFLIRRVLFALPYALTDQTTAIIISGWFCSGLFLFHSLVDVFAMRSTHRLHNASLISIISLCWLQATPTFNGPWVNVIAWFLVLTPFILAVCTHPWTEPFRRVIFRKCCLRFVKSKEKRDKETQKITKKAYKRVHTHKRKDSATPNANIANTASTQQSRLNSDLGTDSQLPQSAGGRLKTRTSGADRSSMRPSVSSPVAPLASPTGVASNHLARRGSIEDEPSSSLSPSDIELTNLSPISPSTPQPEKHQLQPAHKDMSRLNKVDEDEEEQQRRISQEAINTAPVIVRIVPPSTSPSPEPIPAAASSSSSSSSSVKPSDSSANNESNNYGISPLLLQGGTVGKIAPTTGAPAGGMAHRPSMRKPRAKVVTTATQHEAAPIPIDLSPIPIDALTPQLTSARHSMESTDVPESTQL